MEIGGRKWGSYFRVGPRVAHYVYSLIRCNRVEVGLIDLNQAQINAKQYGINIQHSTSYIACLVGSQMDTGCQLSTNSINHHVIYIIHLPCYFELGGKSSCIHLYTNNNSKPQPDEKA